MIRVWDLRDGRTVRTFRGEASTGQHGKILTMASSHDGRWIATGGIMAPGNDARDGAVGDIRLYDFERGNLVGLFRGHRKVVWALAFSPDDQRLILGSEDNRAIIWDVNERKLLRQLTLGDEVRCRWFQPRWPARDHRRLQQEAHAMARQRRYEAQRADRQGQSARARRVALNRPDRFR